MAVWKVARLGRTSSVTGEPFPPDTEVVAALFGEEEEAGEDKVRGSGFTRRDFLVEEATPEHLEGAYCVWHTRTAPPNPEAERRLDLDMAKDLLVRILDEGDEARHPVALTLALLLLRKRRLRLLGEGDGTIQVAFTGTKEPIDVPAPTLTEADATALQQEIERLFGI